MRTSPLSLLFSGVAALILGTLFKLRALPFLRGASIESGSKQVSTAEFASFGSLVFFGFGVLCLIGALIWFVKRKKT